MKTGKLFVGISMILLLLQPGTGRGNIFEKPKNFVTLVFDRVVDIVSNIVSSADDAVVEAAMSTFKFIDRHCECTGVPPYQGCGCCVTIADDKSAEAFCIEVEFSGTSLVSRLIEEGTEVATWEDIVGELAEGVSICVQILPPPASKFELASLSVCVVPEVVEPSFDGGVGYYEICVTLDLGFVDILGYSLNLGCFSFGASSEDWDCVYPNSTNPNELPICVDICPDNFDDWIEQWSYESNPDDDLVFSKHCGAVKTDEGICVKGCFPEKINHGQSTQSSVSETITALVFILLYWE